jgi:hypothetical protein
VASDAEQTSKFPSFVLQYSVALTCYILHSSCMFQNEEAEAVANHVHLVPPSRGRRPLHNVRERNSPTAMDCPGHRVCTDNREHIHNRRARDISNQVPIKYRPSITKQKNPSEKSRNHMRCVSRTIAAKRHRQSRMRALLLPHLCQPHVHRICQRHESIPSNMLPTRHFSRFVPGISGREINPPV